jgi:hypothetical protein
MIVLGYRWSGVFLWLPEGDVKTISQLRWLRKATSSCAECRAAAVTRVAGVYGDPTVRLAMKSWRLKRKKKFSFKLKTTGGISK